jgi:hypothetical protein
MMPETANDTVQIGKDAEVEYSEALRMVRMEPMMVIGDLVCSHLDRPKYHTMSFTQIIIH